MKVEEERYQENFVSFVETYSDQTRMNEKKRIRQLLLDFNKQTYNRQTSSHEYSFIINFSE